MSSPADSPSASPASASGPPWLWLTGFCLARAGFSTINTTYAGALPLVTADWRMSASEAGLVSSAFHVGVLVSLFAVGFVADRFGARRTYLVSSVAAAASALAFAAFARDFRSGLLLYGLAGLFSGGSYTPGVAILAERFGTGRRGLAIGLYISASSAGYGLSLLLSSAAIPLGGWPAAFWATGIGPALGALLGAGMLFANAEARRAGARPAQPLARGAGSTATLVRNRGAMLIVFAYVFHTWELLGIWAWVPYFLAVAHGGGRTTAAASIGAAFGALGHLAGLTGPLLGGWLSDRFGRTGVILVFSLASAGTILALGWTVAAPFWIAVVLALLAQGAGIADSPVLTTGLTELVPRHQIGVALGWRSAVGFGAGALSPWVFGLVLDAGQGGAPPTAGAAWGLAFVALGAGGLLCPLSTLLLRRLPESAAMAGGKR